MKSKKVPTDEEKQLEEIFTNLEQYEGTFVYVNVMPKEKPLSEYKRYRGDYD